MEKSRRNQADLPSLQIKAGYQLVKHAMHRNSRGLTYSFVRNSRNYVTVNVGGEEGNEYGRHIPKFSKLCYGECGAEGGV